MIRRILNEWELTPHKDKLFKELNKAGFEFKITRTEKCESSIDDMYVFCFITDFHIEKIQISSFIFDYKDDFSKEEIYEFLNDIKGDIHCNFYENYTNSSEDEKFKIEILERIDKIKYLFEEVD